MTFGAELSVILTTHGCLKPVIAQMGVSMKCYLTKSVRASWPLKLTAHLSLITGPDILHNCPLFHSWCWLTDVREANFIIYLCINVLWGNHWEKNTHQRKKKLSYISTDSMQQHHFKCPRWGYETGGLCFSGNEERPRSSVPPWCLIRALGQL